MKPYNLILAFCFGFSFVSCHMQNIPETPQTTIAPNSSTNQTTSETVSIHEVPDAIIESDSCCALQHNLSKLATPDGVLSIPAQIKKKGHVYNVTAIGHPDMVEFEGYIGYEEVLEYMEQHPEDYTGEDPNGITTVNLPSTIKHIGVITFHNYSSLTTINCYAKTPPTAIDPEFPEGVTIHVPRGCAESYRQAEFWKDCTIIDNLK